MRPICFGLGRLFLVYTAPMTSPLSPELLQQVVSWRRYLHQHPEVSFAEHQTAAYIVQELGKMPGWAVSQLTPTSVLAVMQGPKPGRTILLRADIDALAIQEENTFDFKSQNTGAMHACGHDGHTAILLGVAQLLSQQPEKVAGEIRLIFQHAEENAPGGAEELVTQTPLMDGVDVVTGLHLISFLPVGQVGLRSGPLMASPDEFRVTVQGKGGHGAMPETTVDPIAIGAQIVANAQHIVSRNTSALDSVVVSITQFHAGTAHNIIPDTAELGGTVRTFDPDIRARVAQQLEQVVRGICEAHGAKYQFEYLHGYRPVVNTPWVVEELRQIATEVLGAQCVTEPLPWMAGEDFSAYLQKAPGAFFFVGSGSQEADSQWPHHHPRFTLDEASLATGIQLLHAAALQLGQGR